MNPNPQSYVLSQSDSRSIFEQAIVPDELYGFVKAQTGDRAAKQPLAVFVVGQTGASHRVWSDGLLP